MNDPFLLQRQSATELFLIRHGDALPGPDEIIPNGTYDDLPLSSIGHAQVQALTDRLHTMHFDALYSSPLTRCQETAAPLAQRLNLTPIIVADIREVRIGTFYPLPTISSEHQREELTRALQARNSAIISNVATSGSWDSIANSEPSHAFRTRVVQAIDTIASRHYGQRVLVFTHGGVINAYAAAVLHLTREFFFPCANTSITIVRSTGTQHALYVLNDVAHLKLGQP